METNAGIDRQIEEEEEGRLIDGEIEGGREVRRGGRLVFFAHRSAPLRSPFAPQRNKSSGRS